MKTDKISYRSIEFDHMVEAQWAVFFDWLGIPFMYRELCVRKGSYSYQAAPFYLPEQHCLLFFAFEEPLDAWGYLNMDLIVFDEWMDIPERGPDGWGETEDGDYVHLWCECPDCGRFGITAEGRTNWLPCKEHGKRWPSRYRRDLASCPSHGKDEESSNPRSPRLMVAYQAAIDFETMWTATHPIMDDEDETAAVEAGLNLLA